MKIGFFVGAIQDEKYGGGHIFQVSVIEELKKVNNTHGIFVYYESETKLFDDTSNVKFINLHFEEIMKRKRKIFQKKKKMAESFDILIQKR